MAKGPGWLYGPEGEKHQEVKKVLIVSWVFGIGTANCCKKSMCNNFIFKYNIKNEAIVWIITNTIPCY